jgi:hypothetical protein
VSTILGAVFIAEGILGAAVRAAYQAGGYPLWEAGLVIFFVGLPVHMLVSAAIHARLASQSFGDGLSVWFVEKSIKLMMALVLGGLLALVIFSRR